MTRLLAAAALGLFILAGVACSNNDNPQPTPTGVPALNPTPPRTVPTPDVQAEAPTPTAPGLDSRLRSLGEGTIEVRIPPGGHHEFDTLRYALDRGIAAPPCAEFVMAFSWQVSEPYPVEQVDVAILASRMGGTFELGVGVSGEGTVGCADFRIRNGASVPVSVILRYVFAEVRR